jgi:membrane-associated PAP2 superfamily phosphatase
MANPNVATLGQHDRPDAMPENPKPYPCGPTLPDPQSACHLTAQRGWRWLGLQIALLVALSIVIAVMDLDRTIAGRFYSADKGWFLARRPLWAWLHLYGTIPGLVLTLAALIGWWAGRFVPALASLHRPCMVVALTAIIAGGLLVNAVFKQYWGRPRPDQTIEFGGQWPYSHILPPGTPGKGASFPCGHCTMGFVFLSMAAFHRRNRLLAYGGITVGIVLGTLLSAARVVQGAHFLSDTLWSLGFITMTATALCMLPLRRRAKPHEAHQRSGSSGRRWWMPLFVAVMLCLAAAGFLTRRPYYKSRDYRFDLTNEIKQIEIAINADPERINLHYRAVLSPRLRVNVHGYGWVKFNFHMRFAAIARGDTLTLELHSDPRSYFAELDHALILILPLELKDHVTVFFRDARLTFGKPQDKPDGRGAVVSVQDTPGPAPSIALQGHRP